jgi:hypothetical protein
MKAIYLKDSLDILNGNKTAIVLPRKVDDLAGTFALAVKSDEQDTVNAVVKISSAKPINVEEFKSYQNAHGITDENRLRWWGNTKDFWLYEIKSVKRCEPVCILIPAGTKLFMDIEQEELYSPLMVLEKIDNFYLIGQKRVI